MKHVWREKKDKEIPITAKYFKYQRHVIRDTTGTYPNFVTNNATKK